MKNLLKTSMLLLVVVGATAEPAFAARRAIGRRVLQSRGNRPVLNAIQNSNFGQSVIPNGQGIARVQKLGQNVQLGGQIGARFLKLENGQPVLNERALRRGVRQFANGKPLNEIIVDPGKGGGAGIGQLLNNQLTNQSQAGRIRERIKNGQLGTIFTGIGGGATGIGSNLTGDTATGGQVDRIRDIADRLREQGLTSLPGGGGGNGAGGGNTLPADNGGVGTPTETPVTETPPRNYTPVETAPHHDQGTHPHPTSNVIGAISQVANGLGTVASSLPSGIGGGVTGSVEVPVAVPTPAALEPAVETPAGTETEATAERAAVDLEVTDLRLVDAGNIEAKLGPRYRLVVRNSDKAEAPKFHVSILVDAGEELTEKAFAVTVESVGIAPGKTQSIDIQLPVEVLTMAIGKDKQAGPFSILAAILDSDERVAESNEENNIVLGPRSAIKPLNGDKSTKE